MTHSDARLSSAVLDAVGRAVGLACLLIIWATTGRGWAVWWLHGGIP